MFQKSTHQNEALRWPSMLGLATASLLASFAASMVMIALPELSRSFSVSISQVQWLVIAYLMLMTLGSIPAGRLGDLYGKRRLLLVGLVVFAIVSVACSMVQDFFVLVLLRGLLGLAAAMLATLALSLVRDITPPDQLGRSMGLMGTVSAIGTALGPSLGGWILATMGWRLMFAMPALLAAVAIALVDTAVPQDEAAGDTGKALSEFNSLAAPGVSAGLVMNLLVAVTMMATLVVGPFYLQGALALDLQTAGLVMAIGPAISVVAGIPAGRLADRFGALAMRIAGLSFMFCACLALVILPPIWGVWGYIIALFLLTPGYQVFQASNNVSVLKAAKAQSRGLLSGALTFTRNLGLIVGASVMAGIFAHTIGAGGPGHASVEMLTRGFQVTFGVASALMVLTLLLAFHVRSTTAK